MTLEHFMEKKFDELFPNRKKEFLVTTPQNEVKAHTEKMNKWQKKEPYKGTDKERE